MKRAMPLSEFFFNVQVRGLNLELPEDRGVLRNRAQAVLDTIPKSALKSGLWERLIELTSSRKKVQSQRAIARDTSDIKVIKTKEVAICLGLYFSPIKAQELVDLNMRFDSEITGQFLDFILSNSISSQEDLLYALATDQQGYRERFFYLFSNLENVPEPDIAIEELDFVIKRAGDQKKRDDMLRAAKLNTSPDQLTDEERSKAQAITTRTS